jgi:hypothetical protein
MQRIPILSLEQVEVQLKKRALNCEAGALWEKASEVPEEMRRISFLTSMMWSSASCEP